MVLSAADIGEAARRRDASALALRSHEPVAGFRGRQGILSLAAIEGQAMRNARQRVWFVYIARCADGSLYTGATTDPARRLRRHNAGWGSAYVRSTGGATLVYVEPQPGKSSALKREMEIKGWTRARKLSLLST